MWFGGLRFQRKLGSLSGRSCLVELTLLIGLSEGGLLCCLLCQMAKEDLDHPFWDFHFVRLVWCSFLLEFGVNFVCLRSVRVTIEEFLLHPPFSEKGGLLWRTRVCTILWGERNVTVFRGKERGIVRFGRWLNLGCLFGFRFWRSVVTIL